MTTRLLAELGDDEIEEVLADGAIPGGPSKPRIDPSS